jgi:hypothetical protein
MGTLANLVTMRAASGLAGLLEASLVIVVKPSVIEAAQSAVLNPVIAKIGPPMGPENAQETDPFLVIAEQDQILAKNSHR